MAPIHRDESSDESNLRPDPATLIPALWRAALKEEVPWEEAFRMSESVEMARLATADSVDRLINQLAAIVPQVEGAALLLADMIQSHASTLDDLGRSREALPLYEAIGPVFEQYAELRQLGKYQMFRAIVLQNCGLLPLAVAGYDQALPLLKDHAPQPPTLSA
jgi:hypothetical protein